MLGHVNLDGVKGAVLDDRDVGRLRILRHWKRAAGGEMCVRVVSVVATLNPALRKAANLIGRRGTPPLARVGQTANGEGAGEG